MSRLKVSTRGCASYYECEDLDAGLPLHAHQPGSGLEHDVKCVAGAVLVWGTSGWWRILRAGDAPLEFDSTSWHGLVPLSVGTAFVNTSITAQGDFESVLDSPHLAPSWVLDARDASYHRGSQSRLNGAPT